MVTFFFLPGPSSDSDLTSLAVDTDSLAELDDGMASGRTSPNQPQGGATNISSSYSPRLPSLHERRTPSPAPASASSAPNPEVSWPGRTPLFSGSLRKVKEVKSDYLDKASELINLAVEKEKVQDYQAAFSCYRSGVDLLLQGVQGQCGELHSHIKVLFKTKNKKMYFVMTFLADPCFLTHKKQEGTVIQVQNTRVIYPHFQTEF